MKKRDSLILVLFLMLFNLVQATTSQNKSIDTKIRILTWNGYVTPEDIREVNQILVKEGYPYKVEVISPFANNAEQMFGLIRTNKCDITFLTLYFIKLKKEKVTEYLQAINIDSPRLTNYKYLQKKLTNIPMGMNSDGKPFYIPFGGGAYGFWADMNKLRSAELPKSVKELLEPKWKGKFSLNISQPYYNIAICSMILGRRPFEINDLIVSKNRINALNFLDNNDETMKTLIKLYTNSNNYWEGDPIFNENLQIVSSWGIEMMNKNKKGANWKIINFKEGNLVWLDTINFTSTLSGKKLEAAEIFANYFIGKKVQNRVKNELSMEAVSSLTNSDPNFFNTKLFVPPFEEIADNIMQEMSKEALKEAKK